MRSFVLLKKKKKKQKMKMKKKRFTEEQKITNRLVSLFVVWRL